MGKIKTFEEYASAASKLGFTLLSVSQINGKSVLKVTCINHSDIIQHKSYAGIYTGAGCKYCYRDRLRVITRPSVDDIKITMSKYDLTFIEVDYSKPKTWVHYICNKHACAGEMRSVYQSVKKGSFCFWCGIEKRSGANSVNYKGSLVNTPIHEYARKGLKEWKRKIIAESNYICDTSFVKANGNFAVHHLISSHVILDNIVSEYCAITNTTTTALSFEDITVVKSIYDIIHKHITGVFISKAIHKLFHDMYGYRHNTPNQYLEFKSDFQKGWIQFKR